MKYLSTAVIILMLVTATGGVLVIGDESSFTADTTPANVTPPISFEAARAQATILHEAMHTTLQVTHDRYYHEDEGLIIPAAALKEVFADLKKRQNITLRWLVVEGQAMNTDHEAQNEFEQAAVKALKSGKPSHEQVQAGMYRRAAPITLSNHCLKCHVPDRKDTRDRRAGLVISIPVTVPAR